MTTVLELELKFELDLAQVLHHPVLEGEYILTKLICDGVRKRLNSLKPFLSQIGFSGLWII